MSVLVLACLIAGCQSRPAEQASAGPAAAPPSPAASVLDSALGDPMGAAAQVPADPTLETVLVPLHDVEIMAQLDGPVVAVDADEGQVVRAGQRLALIDDRERRATLEEYEAALDRAGTKWERAQKLRADQMISEEEFISARAEWQIAKAQRDQALVWHQRCSVRAPFDGIVSLRRVQIAQMVKKDDLLFRVSDPDTLRAELLLPEAMLGTVRAGQAVRLVPVVAGAPVTARIALVNPLVDPASGAFRVRVDCDNRGRRLRGGTTVRVELQPAAAPR